MNSDCRFCGNSTLVKLLDLGNLYLTGQFPDINENVSSESLVLSQCSKCGLVQLFNRLPVEDLYKPGYGYESHLNSGMKSHLISSAQKFEEKFGLSDGDYVCDIASNDGTLLSGYARKNITKIGIDPLISEFKDNYPVNSIKIIEFFSASAYFQRVKSKCKIVTSFSVFYDLDDPVKFARDVCSILHDDGVWILEQSYLPLMLDTNGFDTICHEHLLYLKLIDLRNIFEKSGLEIFDFKINDINGGSIQVFVQKSDVKKHKVEPIVDWQIDWEKLNLLEDNTRIQNFVSSVKDLKLSLNKLLLAYKNAGYSIFGLGASTKGNVLLQYCGISSEIIEYIGEINPKKFGKFTPGSQIKIIDQNELIGSNLIDCSNKLGVILPWHFTSSIVKNASEFIDKGGQLLSPLPFPKIYKK